MGSLLDIVKKLLKSEKRAFSDLSEDALTFPFRGLEGEWVCYAAASDAREEFTFLSIYPDPSPAVQQGAVLDYLNRANYGLVIGNFEMNPQDGEVRFRTGIDTENTPLTEAIVKNMIYSNWVTMDRYLKGMLAVMAGTLSPEAAIAFSERSNTDD